MENRDMQPMKGRDYASLLNTDVEVWATDVLAQQRQGMSSYAA